MKWKKFTLTTTTEAVDLISYTLDELGIEGIEIEDNIPLTEKETKGMFIDILPELPPDEGVAKVSFYLDEDDDIPAMMAKVKEALEELKPFTDLGACTFAESETEDKDWINNWKQYFKPFTVCLLYTSSYPPSQYRFSCQRHSQSRKYADAPETVLQCSLQKHYLFLPAPLEEYNRFHARSDLP